MICFSFALFFRFRVYKVIVYILLSNFLVVVFIISLLSNIFVSFRLFFSPFEEVILWSYYIDYIRRPTIPFKCSIFSRSFCFLILSKCLLFHDNKQTIISFIRHLIKSKSTNFFHNIIHIK